MDDTIASVTIESNVTSQTRQYLSPKTLNGAHYNYKQLKEQCWSLNGKSTSVSYTGFTSEKDQ